MRIALVQRKATEDLHGNVARGLDDVREAAAAGAELVVFPELAFSPFYPRRPASPELLARAEPVPGPTTQAFQGLAKELGVVIVLNLFESAGESTYDASPVIDADGTLLGTTRMLHITEYAGFHERGYYAPGEHLPVHETRVGKIGVAICYDRHYPEVMRGLCDRGADLIVVPQAGALDEWPEGMFEAEMRVASFQSGVFTALCNRVGAEGELTFGGESFVCDPTGVVMGRAARGDDDVLLLDLDLTARADSPGQRLFWRDRRPELYAEWSDRRHAIRHALAALAYRFQHALDGAPEDFGAFTPPAEIRSPSEIVCHMSRVIARAGQEFEPETSLDFEPRPWPEEITRFHQQLQDLDDHLKSGREPRELRLSILLQGPIADALTHVGQIAMLRRLAGSPVPGRSFLTARVVMGRVGPEQDLG